MFRQIFFAAVLAGLVSGLVYTGIQAVKVQPLIEIAEMYENGDDAEPGHDHGQEMVQGQTRSAPMEGAPMGGAPAGGEAAHDHEAGGWMPEDGLERLAYTLLANCLLGIGFSLLVIAAGSLTGGLDLKRGLIFGLIGYASFALAPSFGLPPLLPGMAHAPLEERQLWWLFTAASTAGGLGLALMAPRQLAKLAGGMLLILPHLVGAPAGGGFARAIPAELAADFIGASLFTNLIFWLFLGALSGLTFQFLGKDRAS